MIELDALRKVEAFKDLPDDQLQWLSDHADDLRFETGDNLFQPGDTADYMFAFLEGEMQIRRTDSSSAAAINIGPGEITGILPYSRLKKFTGVGRALAPGRVARFHKNIFPELMNKLPVLGERLVFQMLDRVREVTKMDEQREKLAALGKLSAGLAHELNNPAGAAKRAATSLMEVRKDLREAYLRLDCRELKPKQRSFIAAFEQTALARSLEVSGIGSSSLEQSDREEALSDWMAEHSVTEPWKLAPMLAEAEITSEQLANLESQVGTDALNDTLTRCYLSMTAARLVKEIDQSVNRISELVRAVKEYTYMDQAPEQEIDVHTGIESTLTILAFKLRKKSIEVVRQYDRSLPLICAYGVELNQVWTNLIVNAIEAMSEHGELRIRTWGDVKDIFVEICDNGAGLSEEAKTHLFEPFFTTKGVGEGTGLGLDTVSRVVRKHRGEVTAHSVPGDTRFRVRLPKQLSKEK